MLLVWATPCLLVPAPFTVVHANTEENGLYNYYIHIYKCSVLIVLSATSVLPVPVHHVFQGPPCNVESEVSNKSPADLAGGRGSKPSMPSHHALEGEMGKCCDIG